MTRALPITLTLVLLLAAMPARAEQDPWASLRNDQPFADELAAGAPLDGDSGITRISGGTTGAIDPASSASINDAELDWAAMDDASALPALTARKRASHKLPEPKASWNSWRNANASTGVSVAQPVLPMFNTRIGADMTVAGARAFSSEREALLNRYGMRNPVDLSSGGTAWIAMSAPGLANLWDTTVIDGRIDPVQSSSNWSTRLTKSMDITKTHALAFQQQLAINQFGAGLPTGIGASDNRILSTSQDARLSFRESGTHLIAGQEFSSASDRWLRRVGAEQELGKGVKLSASIADTPDGAFNKSLRASFNTKW